MPIVNEGQLNLAALAVDDVYVVVVPPQTAIIPGMPTDGIGFVGTASRGIVNTPTPVGDPASLVRAFGQINTDTYDLVTEALGAMKQGANNIWCVRVSDGSDVIASVNVIDRVAGNLITFSASSSGTWGNKASVIIGPGSNNTAVAATGTYSVGGTWAAGDTLTATIAGTPVQYTAVANDTPATVTTALTAKINADPTVKKLVLASASTTSTTGTITVTALTKGTDSNAITTVAAKSSTNGTFTAGSSTLANGSGTQTYRVVVQSAVDLAEVFDNISGVAGTGPTSAAQAIVTAINSGVTGGRGPSNIVTAAIAGSPGTGTLLNQGVTLSGGTDGRTGVNANTLLGFDGFTRTGMYALRGAPIAQFGLAGCTDTSSWPTQVAFASGENLVCVSAFPKSTTATSAVTTKNTVSGIDDWHFAVVKDFLWLNDTYNNTVRTVSPIGPTLGKLATLSPERSPGNKPIVGYLGTERTGYVAPSGQFTQGLPYSNAELALLETAGILFMVQPSVGGNYLSLRHGQNASSSPTQNGLNYSRMTPFLAKSIVNSMGWAVNEVHTPELRRRVKSSIAQFLGSLADPAPGRAPMIGDANGGPAYSIVCDNSNNPDSLVARGYLYVSVQVKYLSIVRFFVISVEAGQSVSVQVRNSPIGLGV